MRFGKVNSRTEMPVKHSEDGKGQQLFHICLASLSPIVVSAIWFDVRQRSSYFLHLSRLIREARRVAGLREMNVEKAFWRRSRQGAKNVPRGTEGVLFGARVSGIQEKLWKVQMMMTEIPLRGKGIHREFLVN